MLVFDFRLQVFYTVAQKLSFSNAATALNITQPAVTKHIQQMEQQLGVRLFSRNGNSISLTHAGEVTLRYAEKIINHYHGLETELSQMMDVSGGMVRIGASTTVAQTILPKILALFKKSYPAVVFTFTQGNSDYISHQVIAGALDIAIIESSAHHPQLSYSPFVKDEIVLVTSSANKLAKRDEITLQDLGTIPLVMREAGSGTLEVIMKALKAAGVDTDKLHIEIQLESTIAIKQYLLYSESVAFLSVQSVISELKYQQLAIIDIENLNISRDFQFIQLHGESSKLTDLFKRFCRSHYN